MTILESGPEREPAPLAGEQTSEGDGRRVLRLSFLSLDGEEDSC